MADPKIPDTSAEWSARWRELSAAVKDAQWALEAHNRRCSHWSTRLTTVKTPKGPQQVRVCNWCEKIL